MAIGMPSEFRKTVRETLPKAKISVDYFHVIAWANLMNTLMRRRHSPEVHERRGRSRIQPTSTEHY
ncbi:Transposase [compost metagenome]